MPITNNIIFERIEKKEFEPIPADVYQAQIVDIRDNKKVPYGAPKDAPKTEQYLTFEFTILSSNAKGRKLFKDVRPVTPVPSDGSFKPSWMYKLASAVAGHPLTYEEGTQFGLEQVNSMIGRQLRLIVNQTPKNAQGKSYNNITEVLSIQGEMEPLQADNVRTEGIQPLTQEEVESIPF